MPPLPITLPLDLSYPTVNAYLITEPEPVLIDCGLSSPETLDALTRQLAAHDLQIRDLAKVFITHPHIDHVGLAGLLAESGAEIWLSDLATEWVAELDARRGRMVAAILELLADHGFDRTAIEFAEGVYNRLSDQFSAIPEEKIRSFSIDDTLEFGGAAWQVLYAPGHSNRQVCFYQPGTRELFSGDMLLPKTPAPIIEQRLDDPTARNLGLPELLDSFAKFRELDIDIVYPGHGGPFGDHQRLIDKQVARIHRRAQTCWDLVSSGHQTLPELLDNMYGRLAPQDRLGGFAMLLGYLDLLTAEGRVERGGPPGKRMFVANPETS